MYNSFPIVKDYLNYGTNVYSRLTIVSEPQRQYPGTPGAVVRSGDQSDDARALIRRHSLHPKKLFPVIPPDLLGCPRWFE